MKEKIILRVITNKEVGTGHLFRCMNYSEILNNKNFDSIIVYSGHIRDEVKQILNLKKIKFFKLKSNLNFGSQNEVELNLKFNKNFDWLKDSKDLIKILNKYNSNKLIIDIPGVSQKYITAIGDKIKKLLIDDIPINKINSDIIVNPNLIRTSSKFYNSKRKFNTFIGPDYIPFNKDLLNRKAKYKKRLTKILIYLGSNVALKTINKILEQICNLNYEFIIISEHEKNIHKKFFKKNIKFIKFSKNIFDLYQWADLAIGCCGISAWERCYLCLPSINFISASNQINDAKELHKKKAIINLGWLDSKNISILKLQIENINKSKNILNNMSISSRKIFSKNKKIIQVKPLKQLCMN